MILHAIITAIDVPEKGWYQALTNFGTTVNAVRLKGTDKKFANGQIVSVIQNGSEFGLTEFGKTSVLKIPALLRSGLAEQYKADTVLAYIATLANNVKKLYHVAKVENVALDALTVLNEFTKQVQLLSCSEVSALDFKINDRVLIEIGKPSKIIGWWNCVPAAVDTGYAIIAIGRRAYSPDVFIHKISFKDGEYSVSNEIRFEMNNRALTYANIFTLKSLDADEYFYSRVIATGALDVPAELHWLKWRKNLTSVEEITESEYLAKEAIQPVYTMTTDNKIWWTSDNCYISDTETSSKTLVFPSGEPFQEQFFPIQGKIYKEFI